jgi:peptidoglycan/LPS O-acetylase OafA/YrhL
MAPGLGRRDKKASVGGGGRGVADGAPGTMLPARSRRSAAESFLMRVIATAGIVGICVAVAAIMGSSNAQYWIVGLVVSLISVILAAILWSSRRM